MATYAIRYIELPNGDVCDFGLFGIPYGTCGTAATTQAKVVTISGIATLREGLSIRVKFKTAQQYNGTPTLNLNSLGAKSIYRNGATPAKKYEWGTGDVLDLVYDGTNWIIVNGGALKIS